MKIKKAILTRRDFFKTSTFAAGVILSGGVLEKAYATQEASKNPKNNAHSHSQTIKKIENRGRMFFTSDEDFKILSMATERIFPADDLGAGAIELDVPYFIDNQLAGAYGNNAREYMQGPFQKGSPTQGYQTPMIRQEIFKEGIKSLQEHSKKIFKKGFLELPPNKQDVVLKDFEANKVSMKGVDSSYFFSLLREMTLCGVYADPIYNGNSKMQGWKMKEFPGAQMSYLAFIGDKKFQKIQPMSLADMQNGEQ